jgi:uncharacterized UPF0160 family protein
MFILPLHQLAEQTAIFSFCFRIIMDTQSLLNLLFSSAGLILGWFLRELWAAVKDLKSDLAKLREELPKEYVTKDDYRQDIKELKEMLNKLFDRLNNKADK